MGVACPAGTHTRKLPGRQAIISRRHAPQLSMLLRCAGPQQVQFRALHDLPAGEELTQSYFPLHISYHGRQQRCREQYGFECTCPRCKVPAVCSFL